MAALVEVRRVNRYYGAHAAVRDLSFQVMQGEALGLVGHNGAGKTTVLQLLSGAAAPCSGSVRLDGHSLCDGPPRLRQQVGFLPEVPPLYPEMRVRAYLRLAACLKGLRRGVDAAVDRALGATCLTAVHDERIATLSAGYHRRIGIAQAIVHGPKLVLLDEPMAGLDPLQVAQLVGLLRALRGQHTVVFSSHFVAAVQACCDRVLELREGELAAMERAPAFHGRPRHPTCWH